MCICCVLARCWATPHLRPTNTSEVTFISLVLTNKELKEINQVDHFKPVSGKAGSPNKAHRPPKLCLATKPWEALLIPTSNRNFWKDTLRFALWNFLSLIVPLVTENFHTENRLGQIVRALQKWWLARLSSKLISTFRPRHRRIEDEGCRTIQVIWVTLPAPTPPTATKLFPWLPMCGSF